MPVNQNFTPSNNAPEDVQLSVDVFDFKRFARFFMVFLLESSSQVVTDITMQVNNSTPVSVISLLSNGETPTKKKAEVELLYSATPSPTLKDGNIEYNFTDGETYCVKLHAVIKENVDGVTQTYNYKTHYNFRYYLNPLIFTTFSYNENFQPGDTLIIGDLLLLQNSSYSVPDVTIPENTTHASGITTKAVVFTIHKVSSDICDSDDIYYEQDYNSAGSYDLTGLELDSTATYTVTAQATWAGGYSTSKVSSQILSSLPRPVIQDVVIENLYEYSATDNVVTITIDAITSPPGNQVSKIWFEFYDNNTLVAKAGGVSGTSINTTSNVYSLKLSDIAIVANGGLLVDTNYKVKAKILYTSGDYRTSASFPTENAAYKNFTKSLPEIVGHTINPLYTKDDPSNGKILDISVKKQAYQLYAPSTNGIKFHFYDESSTTIPVASTSSYTFVNSSGEGNVTYPILLSQVTPGVLVNDKDYRIKAEVTLVKHSGATELRLSELSSATESIPDKVNFTKSLPEIVGHTINPLYTKDDPSNGKILDISVKKQAYFLVAPNVANGIKFHFYDGAALVASTSSYTFVNSSGVGNVSYPILLSEVTSGVLVNDKDYRIKAEVTLVKHSAATELRLSELDTSLPYSDKVNFSLKRPFITLNAYDFQVEGEDNADPVIADIVLRKELYELVAPNVSAGVAPNLTDGIKFLIYDSDETTLVGSTKFYTFQNSSANTSIEYNINLSHVTIEQGQDSLENGRTYRVKAQVTIIPHAGSPAELRLSAEFIDLKGSQDAASLSSVTISNSWALATNNNPSSWALALKTNDPLISSELIEETFANFPNVGISGYFKKTPQFNGGSVINHLDIATTKFRIQYSVGAVSLDVNNQDVWTYGAWIDVQKAVLLPRSSTEATLEAAVIRVNAVTPVTSSGDGKFDNVVGSGPGQLQPEMIFFIPQQQVTGTNAFTESNRVKVQISIIDPTNMWNSPNNGITAFRESNSIQLINRINNYDYVVGSSSEPYNTLNGEGHLLLNIPVDWKSIHAHSVVVGYKYVSGDDYSYQTFTYDPTTTISFEVDPITGTTLYYSVAYLVKNVNIGPTATTQGLTIEKNVPIKLFPSSSDYSITNTSYTTFNTGGKSSIKFDLAFNASSTSQIDGINVYFTSPSSTQEPNQGSGIDKTRIATFTASQAGPNKTIQLLHVGSTINYATTLNNTPLNRIDASGAPIDVTNDFSLPWQDFDFANISFEAFRDRRVTTTGASFGTINFVESGSSDFGKTIWNVPVMNSPGWNGPITLEGGVRNSSTATKLSWMQVHNMNNVDFTYDFTMMKNDNSTSLIHDDSGLAQNFKILTIDPNANAKYNITLASVFTPVTTGSMREVSHHPDTIEFNTIHVDVSGINISVQNPSNTTKVNLSFNDAVVSGNTFTIAGATESATFDTNIAEQHVMFTSTDPTMALTRLFPTNNVIERVVSPATTKEYLLPSGSILGQNFSFFMRLKAFIKYKVTEYTNATPTTPTTEILTTSSVEIADQTATDDNSQYIVSSIPIIGNAFTTTLDLVDESPTLNFLLDATGCEVEGFISVVIIIAQDGTESNPGGEAVVNVFPDTGATSDYSNDVAGSGAAPLNPRLTAGESFTTTPLTITGAVYGSHTADYTLTIGDINDATGRFNNSTLKMPPSSVSGFTDGATLNLWILATTRRGTRFSSLTATYTPPVVIRNLSISKIDDDYYANFIAEEP